MTIGETIRRNRISLGITQAQLAEAVGVSEISIRKYEHGERTPKFETIVKLARIFGMNPDDFGNMLISENDDPETNPDRSGMYTTNLPQIVEFLSSSKIPMLSVSRKITLTQEITQCLCNAPELSNYNNKKCEEIISKEEVSITHELFHEIMVPYQDQEIFDIVQILCCYLMLNWSGKKLVQDILEGLLGNKNLAQKEYDPKESRPEKSDVLSL